MLVSSTLHRRWTAGDRNLSSNASRDNHGEIQGAPAGRIGASDARILIVEDDPDARYIYSTILGGAGYQVDTAENGREGLDSARALIPDLIIMDINLPLLGGWEAIELLRASAATHDIPVCVVSAGLTTDSYERAESLGCDGLFAKPLSPRELLAGITRILSGRARDA